MVGVSQQAQCHFIVIYSKFVSNDNSLIYCLYFHSVALTSISGTRQRDTHKKQNAHAELVNCFRRGHRQQTPYKSSDIPEFIASTTQKKELRFDVELFTQCVSTWDKDTEKNFFIARFAMLYVYVSCVCVCM